MGTKTTAENSIEFSAKGSPFLRFRSFFFRRAGTITYVRHDLEEELSRESSSVFVRVDIYQAYYNWYSIIGYSILIIIAPLATGALIMWAHYAPALFSFLITSGFGIAFLLFKSSSIILPGELGRVCKVSLVEEVD